MRNSFRSSRFIRSSLLSDKRVLHLIGHHPLGHNEAIVGVEAFGSLAMAFFQFREPLCGCIDGGIPGLGFGPGMGKFLAIRAEAAPHCFFVAKVALGAAIMPFGHLIPSWAYPTRPRARSEDGSVLGRLPRGPSRADPRLGWDRPSRPGRNRD